MTIIDNYEIKEPLVSTLGRRIHRAVYKPFNMNVIVKIVDKNTIRDTFINDLTISSQVENPFVTNSIATCETDNLIYSIEEFFDGGSLRTYFSEFRPRTERILRNIFIEILLGLEYLHSKNIIHRNLSLDTIMIDKNGVARITNYELAAQLIPHTAKTFKICGGISNMAPEIMRGGGYGFEVDIWSLGVILYNIFCGVLPFDGRDANEKMHAIMELTEYYPSYGSGQFKDMLKGMLNKNPEKRLTINQIWNHPWIRDRTSRDYVMWKVPTVDKNDIYSMMTELKIGTVQIETETYSMLRSLIMSEKLEGFLGELLDDNNKCDGKVMQPIEIIKVDAKKEKSKKDVIVKPVLASKRTYITESGSRSWGS
jgi:serine/threonine protein kinase